MFIGIFDKRQSNFAGEMKEHSRCFYENVCYTGLILCDFQVPYAEKATD